jgi:hypothetical protein
MFSKTTVTGARADPLLPAPDGGRGSAVRLQQVPCRRRGKVVARFAAGIEPYAGQLRERLQTLL